MTETDETKQSRRAQRKTRGKLEDGKKSKRRIKRAKKSKRYYFDANTQRAIELYQSSNDTAEKERLYVEKILPAFDELVESLIRIYKFTGLYDSHDDLKNDCITFLYETLYKFDPTRAKKAFSYFNVVAKNWLIVRSKKRQTSIKKIVSLDVMPESGRDNYDRISSPTDGAQYVPVNASLAEQFTVPGQDVQMETDEMITQLMKMFVTIREKLTNENEIRCIDAIITLFEDREKLPILKKRAVFTYIRNMSGLTSKQLTMAISVIKRHYNSMKCDEEFGIF